MKFLNDIVLHWPQLDREPEQNIAGYESGKLIRQATHSLMEIQVNQALLIIYLAHPTANFETTNFHKFFNQYDCF